MMTAIVFNGTKIYMDSDMELHVIRGDLHIDTKAYKAVPKARSVSKRGTKAANGGLGVTATLREASLKVGKSVTIDAKRNTISSALKAINITGSIRATGKEGSWLVTRTA